MLNSTQMTDILNEAFSEVSRNLSEERTTLIIKVLYSMLDEEDKEIYKDQYETFVQ